MWYSDKGRYEDVEIIDIYVSSIDLLLHLYDILCIHTEFGRNSPCNDID